MQRATERVFVTQSALSLQMKRLEDPVQASLFKRVGRRLCLTCRTLHFMNAAINPRPFFPLAPPGRRPRPCLCHRPNRRAAKKEAAAHRCGPGETVIRCLRGAYRLPRMPIVK